MAAGGDILTEMETVGNTESAKILFFDTGFIRRLLAGDYHHLLTDLESDLRGVIKTPFAPWRTSFSLMEWIGLNSEALPKPPPFDLGSRTGADFIEPAFRHYEAHYLNLPELRQENLMRMAEEQTARIDPRVRDIWDTMIGGVFDDPTFSESLRFSLAFDAVHKLDVRAPHRGDYWSDLISAGFFNADCRIRNRSKFRLAYRIWIRRREQLSHSVIRVNDLKWHNEHTSNSV